MANVCLYGGQAKGEGTQGCSCFAAPDCSKQCQYGGTAKADGTDNCICATSKLIIEFNMDTVRAHVTGGISPYTCIAKGERGSKTYVFNESDFENQIYGMSFGAVCPIGNAPCSVSVTCTDTVGNSASGSGWEPADSSYN